MSKHEEYLMLWGEYLNDNRCLRFPDFLEAKFNPKDTLYEAYQKYEQNHFFNCGKTEERFKALKKLFGLAGLDEFKEALEKRLDINKSPYVGTINKILKDIKERIENE